MADPASLVFEFVKQAKKIVEMGMEHKRTAQKLEMTENELRPMFEKIEELRRKMNFPANETERLKSVLRDYREAYIKHYKIEWWNCFLAPWYKYQLDKADKSMQDFISTQLQVQTHMNTLEIRYHLMGTGVDAGADIPQLTLMIDEETLRFPEFQEGLNSELMGELKSRLTMDGGDQILNLNGLTGTGKTTLALQLCGDTNVRGWFNGNVCYEPVGSKIKSNGEQLASELREKWSDRKGLLVVDDVEAGSKNLFNQCLRKLPSNSKILAISRDAVSGLGRSVAMKLLEQGDSVTLLRHFARPIGTSSCDLPDDHILRRVAAHCGGLPMAIKMTGLGLQGKPIEFWQQYLREREGQTILKDDSTLLDYFHNYFQVKEEFKAVSKYFLDLALFPKHEIPVSALLDLWVEVYEQDEDGIEGMTYVHRLTAMHLAERVLQRRETGSSNVDDQILTQHNIIRELASKYSREQAGESDLKRLIVETNRNDHPRPNQFLLQQPQQVINACLRSLKASILQPRVVAPILSITTDQNVTPEDLRFIQAAKAQALILNLSTHEYTLPEVIKEMKNLKVLIVTNYGLPSTQFRKVKLLGFLKALKRIRLQHVTVPCVWKLQSLRKLSLYMCEVKKAFEDSSLEFSEATPNLMELKIEGSTDLEELPAGLCDIVGLKKLSITKCRNFTKLPQEIGKLIHLELLSINSSAKFEEMPKSITELRILRFLDISFCVSLTKLPEEIGKLQNLTELYMTGCSVEELPVSIMDLEKLERVICDETAYSLWEVMKSSLPGLNIKMATVDISLNLLP